MKTYKCVIRPMNEGYDSQTIYEHLKEEDFYRVKYVKSKKQITGVSVELTENELDDIRAFLIDHCWNGIEIDEENMLIVPV